MEQKNWGRSNWVWWRRAGLWGRGEREGQILIDKQEYSQKDEKIFIRNKSFEIGNTFKLASKRNYS